MINMKLDTLHLTPRAGTDKPPKHLTVDRWYPILGYQTRMRKDEASGENREEIGVFLCVNDDYTLSYVYPSLCNFRDLRNVPDITQAAKKPPIPEKT